MREFAAIVAAIVMILLIMCGFYTPGSPRQSEQVWLSQCAQHRPLHDCREDWNVLKGQQ